MARRGLNGKGLTLKNIAFVGGIMTFTFLVYAFVGPRLITPKPAAEGPSQIPNAPLPGEGYMPPLAGGSVAARLPAPSGGMGAGLTVPEIQRVSGYTRGYQARSNVFPYSRRLNLS